MAAHDTHLVERSKVCSRKLKESAAYWLGLLNDHFKDVRNKSMTREEMIRQAIGIKKAAQMLAAMACQHSSGPARNR
jgi:hypothetical protein